MGGATIIMLLMLFVGFSEIDAASSKRQTGPAPGTLAYLDAKNGFRDLTFGDPPTPEMDLVTDAGDLKTYVRPSDDLTLGGAQLQTIGYRFYKDCLYSVAIIAKGYANGVAILEVLRQAYGKGEQPNQFLDEFLWRGRRVWVLYGRQRVTETTDVLWQSVPLDRERQAAEKDKAKKGVDGL
jgi:hypothetical protein